MGLFPMLALSLATLAQNPSDDLKPRFEPRSPLTNASPVMMDARLNDFGEAQRIARERNLQARILWIDATANIDRYNTEEKIVGLVRQIKTAGFNTIVFDVKPISGQVVYPSKIAPKLTTWRDKSLPPDFDPLAVMVREAHANDLVIFTSLNAFSEGHRMFLVGPGYERPGEQTVLYETTPVLQAGDSRFPLSPTLNAVAQGQIGAFTSSDKLPTEQEGAFAVTLDKRQKVVDGFEQGGIGQNVPTVPKGGEILYGTDTAADWLRKNATPGTVLQFDTDPLFVPITERPEQQYPLMMNPNDPAVQQYALDVVRELVHNYAVDGVLYDDRLRYAGINADFSQVTRDQFESKLGKKLNWPDDVFKFTITPNLTRGMRLGPYYDQWMAFRAATIRDFVGKVRSTIQRERPGILLGDYAGSWYGEYPSLGSNWASPAAEAGFWFLDPAYQKTGFAPSLDFLITGCYYPTATIYDAMSNGRSIGATVEAAGMLSNRMVRDQAWTYAGIALSDFADDPEGLTNALQAACASTQGVMVFDLSHNIDPMWPVFAKAFSSPATAPHRDMKSLDIARHKRNVNDILGKKDPPIVIAAGSSGTGQ